MPNLGYYLPIVGIDDSRLVASGLADALFTKAQQHVLGLLFGQPERSFYASEIIELAGMGSGSVQRELEKLERAGLVLVSRQGTRKYFQANPESPIHQELCSVMRKTTGLLLPLRRALEPLERKIAFSFVYGSVAGSSDRATSDIDVLIVGEDISYTEIIENLQLAEQILGRPVSPTLYTPKEFAAKSTSDGFARRVMAGEKIWILGSEEDVPESA